MLKFKDKEIRGDLIEDLVIRSDLAPMPVTMEATIRRDESIKIETGSELEFVGLKMHVLKCVERQTNGMHPEGGYRITAVMDGLKNVVFARENALIRENAGLPAILRTLGYEGGLNGAIQIPRFYCLSGDAPSFHINKALRDAGSVMRYKQGFVDILQIRNLPSQTIIADIADRSNEVMDEAFAEHHEIDSVFSTDPSGAVIWKSKGRGRRRAFVPLRTVPELQNIQTVLVRKRTVKTGLDLGLCAGDLVRVGGYSLIILTATHAVSDGYTKLWLGDVEVVN